MRSETDSQKNIEMLFIHEGEIVAINAK